MACDAERCHCTLLAHLLREDFMAQLSVGWAQKCSWVLQANTTQPTPLCCAGLLQPKAKASAAFSWELLFIPRLKNEAAYDRLGCVPVHFVLI